MPRTALAPSGRMRDLAAAVERLTASKGYAPSFREIGAALGVGLPRTRDLAIAARERGIVEFKDGSPRTIRIATRTSRGR